MGLIEETTFDFQSPKLRKAKHKLFKRTARARNKMYKSRETEGNINEIFSVLLNSKIIQPFYKRILIKEKQIRLLRYIITIKKRNQSNEIWYDEVIKELKDLCKRVPKTFIPLERYPIKLTYMEKIFLFGFKNKGRIYFWFDGYGFYIGNKKMHLELHSGRGFRPETIVFNYFFKRNKGLFFKAVDKMYLRESAINKFLITEESNLKNKLEKYLIIAKI